MPWTARKWLLAIAIVAGGRVLAQDGWLESGLPIGVKIDGYVGAAPKGTVPADKWVVDIKAKNYKFQVMKLTVLTGDTFYMNIFSALDPYPIALQFTGEALDTIINAPPGREISIIGTMQFGGGARLLMVSSVTLMNPATPSPAS
jgi:hypothetical protein